jgi:signal transduction histidine kinase
MVITSTPTLLERINLLLAEFEERKKFRDTTCGYLGIEALSLAKQGTNKHAFFKASSALSHFYTDIISDFKKALQVLEDTLNYLGDEADRENKAETYRRIGLNYNYLGEYIQSKSAYSEGIKLLESYKLSEAGFLTLARIHLNLSITYFEVNLENLSLDHLNKAYNNFSQINDKSGLARCYISYGNRIQDVIEKRQECLDHYFKAAQLAEEINDPVCYGVARGNYGMIKCLDGDFENGIPAMYEALEKSKNFSNKRFLFGRYMQLARAYSLQKNYEEADKWYTEGDVIFKEIEASSENFQYYKHWALMLAEAGRHKEAYEKFLVHDEHKDKLHNFDKLATANDALLRFKLEESQRDTEILKQKNEQIEAYTRKLEISNYELKQFAHVASHDMKEPLRMVSNYSQLLSKCLKDKITPEETEYLSYLEEGSKRMVSVINSLLQLSKINATICIEKVDVGNVLTDVRNVLKLQIEQHNAKIEFENMPVVFADRVQIQQLLQNLISNALKYNESSSPHVRITYQKLEHGHRFNVADNGIGIAREYREKVFIIFQRLHGRDEYEGTGIGLAICKKIVDNLNGKIWIEDSPLGGAMFCFTIPTNED